MISKQQNPGFISFKDEYELFTETLESLDENQVLDYLSENEDLFYLDEDQTIFPAIEDELFSKVISRSGLFIISDRAYKLTRDNLYEVAEEEIELLYGDKEELANSRITVTPTENEIIHSSARAEDKTCSVKYQKNRRKL